MNKRDSFVRFSSNEHIRADLRGKSVRAAMFTWGAGIGEMILRLASTALLARLIAPEHFGLVMMVSAITGVVDQFRDLGLSTATVQHPTITHDEVSKLFWINTGIGTGMAILICACSPLVSNFYKEPRLTAITCALTLPFIFGGLTVQHQALLTRQLNLGKIAAIRLSSNVLSVILAAILAWQGFDHWALVWREVLRSLAVAAGMFIFCPWLPGIPARGTNVTGLLTFGAHLSFANILGALSSGADRLILGRSWGAETVAVFRQSYQLLVMPMDQVVGPVYTVAQPGLSMVQGDPDRFARFYRKMLVVVCLVTMPLSMFVAVFANEVATVLLGDRWQGAGAILMILSIGAWIRQPVGSSAFILLCRGRSNTYLKLTVFQITVGVLGMLVGSKWGGKGIAVADAAVCYALVWPRLHFSLADSPFSIRMFFAAICRPTFASLIMATVLFGFKLSVPNLGDVKLLLLATPCAALAFLLSWSVLPGGKEELLSILTDLRSALGKRFSSPLQRAAN